ncbi:hypothetical protein [Meiothermus taiwanensis]|jgi:hypothetical protein|uniref:Uncharacterized protein n=2 Tax=Meiothermus taiwanensis TaxID=172827 RepID=A0A399DSF8_9DEIN|nr:hypothetical protein [Meiothermus taiwanensis]KIQ54561.1 hypothetical protein SY28_08000 [Meiothermus taiwanensis]KZK15864.1 hypothetical protein A3962_08525 [Meiothermus taiwanensis]RIH74927.1 hypothetical protein Mcate_02487 [Meiothermus taiwanensis]
MSQRTEFYSERGVAVLASYTRAGYPVGAPDRLAALLQHLGPLIETAVDAQQVAAVLEAHGYNDRMVMERYGYPNVFELAEALYRIAPRRAAASRRKANRLPETLRELSHGLFYGMPGLFFPAIFAWVGAREATLGLILSAILGWAWSQGMIRLAYVLMGRGFAAEARRLLQTMFFLGLGPALLVSLLLQADLALSVLVVLQTAYHMASSILLLYKRELWLLLAALPAALVGVLFLWFPDLLGAANTVVVMMISVLLSVAAALLDLRTKVGHSPWKVLQKADWLDAIPLVLYGFFSAVFVFINPFWHWVTGTSIVLGLAVVPLVLSMGGLEWQLRVFLERVSVLLASTSDLRVFARNINRIFLSALASYAGLLLAISLLAKVFFNLNSPESEVFLVANFLLGIGFFVAFTLTSMNRTLRVLLGMMLALLVYAVVFALSIQGVLPLDESVSYLLGCGVFTSYLLLVALPVLRELRNYQ